METKPLNIYQKIDAVKSKIGKLSKDLDNPFFKSKYFDVNQLIDQCEVLLRENGLMLMQPIIEGCLVSQIIDLSTGEKLTSSLKLPELNDPQKVGSAITYYRRYALQSQLALQAEDDDANKASGKATDQAPKKDEDQRPWLNATQFKSALTRIQAKEPGVYEKLDKAFKMSKDYRNQLKTA